MRGEDVVRCVNRGWIGGSPPHARGRRITVLPINKNFRITPACAGKTPWRRRSSSGRRDHPRMRGEDSVLELKSKNYDGSPPHARGRLDVSKGEIDYERITPACAGKTEGSGLYRSFRRDHPRMRGEDLKECMMSAKIQRITPACAGKTLHNSPRIPSRTDHPRMRGEDNSRSSTTR